MKGKIALLDQFEGKEAAALLIEKEPAIQGMNLLAGPWIP
jgi:hypothetical protein